MRSVQRLTNLLKYSFGARQIRDSVPATRNGGTLCIPRNELDLYYQCKLKEVEEVKAQRLELVPEVRAFKKEIEEDPVLRMGFTGALDSLTPR